MKYQLKKWCLQIFFLSTTVVSGLVQSYSFPIEYPFQHITREQGLSQGTAYTISQDQIGYMWFGTQEGLNRFDGRRIQVFSRSNTQNTLVDSYIYTILNDRENSDIMWLGTHGGLHRYSHSSGQFELQSGNAGSEIAGSRVYHIDFADAEQLWLATDNGLNLFNHQSGSNQNYLLAYRSVSLSRLNNIYDFLLLDNQYILLATGAGLFVFDRVKAKVVQQIDIPENPTIWKLLKDSQNIIWIGTAKGLYQIDELSEPTDLVAHKLLLAKFQSEQSDENVYALFEDNKNAIWVGSGDGAFHLPNGETHFIHLKNSKENPHSLINNTIYSIFQDANGLIWLGTDSGISRYNPESADFNLLTKRDDNTGLSHDWVISLHKSSHNNLWVATNNGIDGFDADGQKNWHFDVSNGLSSQWAYSLQQTDANTLWAGTFDGLNRIDIQSGTITQLFSTSLDDSINHNRVWNLLPDGDSHLWVGTHDGLNRLNINTGKVEAIREGELTVKGLTDERVYALHRMSPDTLWIGTSRGLNRYNSKTNEVEQFKVDSNKAFQLSNEWITDVSSDSQQRVWIATNGGLNIYDPQFKRFHQLDQFKQALEFTYTVEVDAKDRVWFSTNSGIGRLKYTGDLTTNFDATKFELVFFTQHDGLQSNEFNEFASQYAVDGNLYFGGVNGLNWFHPDNFEKRDQLSPLPVITQIEVNDELVFSQPGEKKAAGLKPGLNINQNTQSLNLAYFQNHLTFYFAALDYANPAANKIEYRMLGFDDTWHRTTANQPFVSFQKLASGNYTLEVRAATQRSEWHPQKARLNIYIEPPFWLSWWAYSFYLIALLVIVSWSWWGYKLRIRRLSELVSREQQATARLKEVDGIKDQFLANTSHELKTPLNAIIGLSEYLLSEQWSKIEPADAREALQLIKESGTRMNGLVEDILQSSSLIEGKLQLNILNFSLFDLVNECFREVEHSKMFLTCELINRTSKNNSMIIADRNRIKQVLLNLLGNSIKFTHQGEISVSASETDQFYEVKVSDSGIGIDEKHHRKIFDAFVQVDGSPSREFEGSGLGLSIVKQLVSLHGGEVYLHSKLTVGTQITFTLSKHLERD